MGNLMSMTIIGMILQALATSTPRTAAELRQDRNSIDMAALEARVAELETDRRRLLLAGGNDALRANDDALADARIDVERASALIEELDRLAAERPAPARVLDVGAGSGILAIAAVKLWPAATVVAVDNDPIAVAACAENAGVNAVGDRIASAATPVGDVDGQFDLVLANIQAHVLRELLPGIAPRVAPGGTLVMSGLLSPQAEAVAEDYAAVGFTVEAIRPSAADPAWSSAVLRRPS